MRNKSLRAGDFTKFRLSKPWGYHPVEVENMIDRYEAVIKKLSDTLSEKTLENSKYEERIRNLEYELKSMHIEMSSLELPEPEEVVASVVFNEFKNYPNNKSTMPSYEGVETQDPEAVEIPVENNENISETTMPVTQDETIRKTPIEGLENKETEDGDDLFRIVT